MAAVRNLTHGELKIVDGTTPTANELIIPLDNGNLRFTRRRPVATIMNRGVLSQFANTPQQPVDLSFSFKFQEWRGETGGGSPPPSPHDALTQAGNASSWASTITPDTVYTVDLVFTLSNPQATGGQSETLTFSDFHATEFAFEEGEEFSLITASGQALVVTPVATRA